MSYNTVAEADQYISEHYTSNSSVRTMWYALEENDKQVLLNRGHDIIDSLPLVGCKHDVAQMDAFPRCCDEDVPLAVKHAEVELSVAYADENASEVQDQYRKMIDYGISSYSIGNFSESLLTYQRRSLQMTYGLISAEAERLLQPWISGGYRIG